MIQNYEVVVSLLDGDARELSRTFESGRLHPPLSVGSQGDWIVLADGVATIHLWFQFDGQRLYVASADAEAATYLQNVRIDKAWHEVAARSELRFGQARMRVLWRPSDPVVRVESPPSSPIERAAALPLPSYFQERTQGGRDTAPGAPQPELHRARARNLRKATPRSVTRAVVASSRPPRRALWVALVVAAAGLAVLLGFLWLVQFRPRAAVGTVAVPASVETARLGLITAPPDGSRASELPLAPLPTLNPPPMVLPRAAESLSSVTCCNETLRAYPQNVADKPVPRLGEQPSMISNDWRARHERQLHASNRGQAKVIFLGDSITEGWAATPAYREHFAKYTPLNLGLAGDFTQNVLWRLDHGALRGTNPEVLVLMIGVNNLAGGFSPQQTVAGIRAIVAALQAQLPTTRLLLLAILPARKNPDDALRQRIVEANRLLAGLPASARVSIHDVGSVLLESDGTLSEGTSRDFLHPTAAGYERLSDAVAPLIDELLAHDAE